MYKTNYIHEYTLIRRFYAVVGFIACLAIITLMATFLFGNGKIIACRIYDTSYFPKVAL